MTMKEWIDSRPMRCLEKLLGGHVTIGPLTLYGLNAMHCAANLDTRWGWLCFRPPIYHHRWHQWYLYLSYNATPGGAIWGTGPGFAR